MSGVETHQNETDGGVKCKEGIQSQQNLIALKWNPFAKISNNQPAKLSKT